MSLGGGRRGARAIAALALSWPAGAAIGGCGSGARVTGRAVFAADCAVCHSISGHSAPKQQGGDLLRLRLPREELIQYAAEMPAIHHRLTAAEVSAVVDYMRLVQRR